MADVRMPSSQRRAFAALRAVLWCACLLLSLVLPAWAQAPIPTFASPVVDTTNTLDAATRQKLEQQALALQQRKGSQLQVLMIPSTQPEGIEAYAVRAFESFKLGRKGIDDGVLLVIAKDDRKARIEVGYGLEGAIPDIAAGRIIQEYMVPKFRQGDYAGGVEDATAQLVKLVDGEPLPEPVASNSTGRDSGDEWLFALFAAFMASLVARSMFGRLPVGLRSLFTVIAGGVAAWLFSWVVFVGGVGAVIGFFTALMGGGGGGGGRYARHHDWGGFGGGSGGGGWGGGSSGGGWSGGGGMSGGGGASGGW